MTPLEGVRLTLVDSFEEAQEFARWLSQPRPVLGLDTETEGLDWWRDRLRMIQVGDEERGFALPFPNWGGLAIDLLSRYRGPIVLQNAKFDAHHLRQWAGWRIPWERTHDTKVMAHLVDPLGPQGLKQMGAAWVDPRIPVLEDMLKKGMAKNRWTWATVPYDFAPYWQYGALDPVITARVAARLWPLAQPYRSLYETEMGLERLLSVMEEKGMAVDVDYCVDTRHRLASRIDSLAAEIAAQWDVDPGSSQSLASRFQALGVELTARTEKGAWSMDEAALRALDHPLADAVLELRGLRKVADTYLKNFIEFADGDGLLHASVKATGARTGRMSVSRPSLQNIPRSREARWAFTAREGNRLVLADYEQIEMRIMAHYSQDETMIAAIRSGADLHTRTAQGAYGLGDSEPSKRQRQIAKSANFAKIYGAGLGTFAATAGIGTLEAKDFLDRYARTFPRVDAFMREVQSVGRRRLAEEGEAYVTTWGGRRLPSDPDKLYTLCNYLIQGSARDVLGVRMLEMARAGLEEFMVLPVHDEVIMDVPEGDVDDVVETVRRVMPDTESFAVPLEVDVEVAERWGEKYD